MTPTQATIAIATFAYFLIGGTLAILAARVNTAFAGRTGWEPLVLLLAWPFWFALTSPLFLTVAGVLTLAAGAAYLAARFL